MLKGSCLCAGVSYEINGPLEDLRNCHCAMCHKAPWFEITDSLPRNEKASPR